MGYKERNIDNFYSQLYVSMNKRNKKRGHGKILFKAKEFRAWLFNQSEYKGMFEAWDRGGRNIDNVPTVDRLNDSKGYVFDNMQLLTFRQNIMKPSIIHRKTNPVIQLTLSGEFVKEWDSVNSARRGFAYSVVHVLSGRDGSCKGFKWRYKNNK